MGIYSEDGSLDIDGARKHAQALGPIGNEGAYKRMVSELTIGALLDIASSLRVLATESAVAMGSDYLGIESEVDDTSAHEAHRVPLEVGDLVHVHGHTGQGTVMALGVSEGSDWADVRLVRGDGGQEMVRVWTETVVLDSVHEASAVTIDEDGDNEEAVGGYELDTLDEDEEIEKPDAERLDELVDDIDADFDGGHHPTAADAVATLKANEAARKAAKKSGSKKEKKA